MSFLGFLYDLFFGETPTAGRPRGPCPSCLREGLETYPDKAISEIPPHRKVVTPAAMWRCCIYCGSKFKKGRFATELEPVSDEEWDRHVEAPKAQEHPGTKPTTTDPQSK